MRYFDYLESNKKEIVEQLERIFELYKVEPVGDGYIDCIVLKDNMQMFINEISASGILITDVSWWCYVSPNNNESSGCPHGMGGPKSKYYDGWFSELQNAFYEVDKDKVESLINSYDSNKVSFLNMQTIEGIQEMLRVPFRYTPTEYIRENKCVMPGIWLLIPHGSDASSRKGAQ